MGLLGRARAKLPAYARELRTARRLAASNTDLVKLVTMTGLYHLGNGSSLFRSRRRACLRCRCNGRDVSVELRRHGGDVFTLYEVLGALPYAAPYELLGRVETVVDLGANIGLTSLYYTTLFPTCRVIAVEPEPENFDLLSINCRLNGVNATCINACIGAEPGHTRFYLSQMANDHSVIAGRSKTETFIDRAVVSMDGLMTEQQCTEVDILKVDIEGAEGDLFRTCGSWIRKVRFVIVELHPPWTDRKAVIRAVTSFGFQCFRPGTLRTPYDVFLRADVAERWIA